MDDYEDNYANPASHHIDLQEAVAAYLSSGGIIQQISIGTSGTSGEAWKESGEIEDIETTRARKAEHLKELVAKGAGISALQYSLRMNKRELRRMAGEQNIKIPYSRPIPRPSPARHTRRFPIENNVDDETAGMIVHLNLLGNSALEIAQILEIRVRQVWIVAKEYKFALAETTTEQDL